jgi:hypothetical protein
MTITATIARGIKVDTNVTLDIVRYCKHEYAPGKICGRLEDHEIHNMLMPTPDHLATSLIGHHEFEPDIPWDWDGSRPAEFRLDYRHGPSTGRINCSKPNLANVGRAETAWTRLCAAEDAEGDDE